MQLGKLAILPLLFASSLLAQVSYSTITGTVVDSNLNPLAGAQISATLVRMNGGTPINGLATPNGQLFNGSPVRGTLDSAGHFSISLVPNGILSQPNGAAIQTQWVISISAPQDSFIYTYGPNWNISYQFTVAGNADLSTQLSNLVTAPISYLNTKTNQSTLSAAGGCPLGGCTFTGPVKGTTLSASVNRVLMVTASPYNAKCDGVTDDQPSIQAAFNDAQANGQSVQFPAGTCLTSTITYYGQPFFGAGKNVTIIKGKPGQDVLSTPDSNASLDYAPHIHDVTIQVDNTVNAAATAAGGNNTFPNRIFGTAGGTTPLAAAYGGPPAPGPLVYNPNTSGSCGASISSGSNVLAIPCGGFFNEPVYYVTGGAVTVNGAGPSGGNLTTTVSSVTNGSTLVLAANASTTVSSVYATVTAAARIAPPWYCGNAGIAVPASSGANMSEPNGWTLDNVQFSIVNGPNEGNNVCAFFLQAAPNAMNFQHVDVQSFYGGIIEAPPATNNSSYFAWTDDTATYDDVNLKSDIIPMTWINGSHRKVGIISIYGGNVPFTMGLFQFSVPLGTSGGIPSATFSHYYDECWSNNSGEHARFSGNSDNILGGSLGQCNGTAFINFLASYSNVGTAPAGVAGGTSISIENRGANNIIGNPTPLDLSPCGFSYYPSAPGGSCYYDPASPINQSIDLPTSFSGSQIIGPQWRVSGGTLSGGNLQPIQTTFALNLKSAAGASPTIGIICDSSIIASITPTLTSTNTWFYLRGNLNSCTSGFGHSGNLGLIFNGAGYTNTITVSDIQALQQTVNGFGPGGFGASLATGPNSGTFSGHIVTYSDTSGTESDSGTALSSLAPLASPSLTGTPLAPTDTSACDTHTTQIATEQYVANCGGGSSVPPTQNVYNVIINGSFDNTGATDESSATATLLTNGTQQVIYFPPGTYNFNAGMHAVCSSGTCNGLNIVGAGRGQTIFTSTCSGGIPEWWIDLGTNNVVSGSYWYGPKITGIEFKDTSGTGACSSGLRLTQMANFHLNDIEADNFAGKVYSTGTVTVTNGSTSVTSSGATFTAAMVAGQSILHVAGRPQFVCGETSTTLTLCAPWQQATATGTAYSLDYGGTGLLFDGGQNYIQYGMVDGYWSQGDMVGIGSMPSTSSAIGTSRIWITGGFINGLRVADSKAGAFGGFTDTISWDIAANNTAWGTYWENAHDNRINGFVENDGALTVVNTCNGGVAAQSCAVGHETTGDATSKSYGNSFSVGEVYNTGNAVYVASTSAQYISITNPKFMNSGGASANLNDFNFMGTAGCPANASGNHATIVAWNCIHFTATVGVN